MEEKVYEKAPVVIQKPKKNKITKKMSTPEKQERYEAFVEYHAYLVLKYGHKILKK